MRTLASYSGQAIFIKTAKDQDEIAQRRFGLNMRQRRVLIVMDGTKNRSAIEAVMPKEELEEVISFLAEHGFIVPAETVLHKGPPANAQSGIPHMPAHGEHCPLARHLSPHNSAPVQDAATGKIDESALLQDEERIRQIKDFMTTTATTYLGLLSADVIHRIERAKGAANLMAVAVAVAVAVAGYRHMALRESKQGGRFAGPHLEQVTAALTGKTVHIEADQV